MGSLSAGSRDELHYRECLGESSGQPCAEPVLIGNPLALCGRHTRQVYEYASSIIDSTWRERLRDVTGIPDEAVVKARKTWVYIIKRDGRIKIGYTRNLTQRWTALRPDLILHVEPGGIERERELHALFTADWITGEWFNDSPAIRDYIAAQRAA